MTHLRRLGISVLALTLFGSGIPARADPTKEAAPSAAVLAVKRGDEGVTLFERGQWKEALAAFDEAEGLYHSPVFVLFKARTLRNSGRLLEARAVYRQLSAESVVPTAPEAWRRAKSDARDELASLERDIPSVVLILTGDSRGARITVDGAPVATGQRIELDPGKHVAIAARGARRDEKAFTVAVGADQERVVLSLLPTATPVSRDRRGSSPGPYLPGVILAGVGGAALVAGAVVGGLALSSESSATKDCVGATCPPSRRGEIESGLEDARALGTTADVLVIGGATLAAVGVVLWIVDPRAPVSTQSSSRGGGLEILF